MTTTTPDPTTDPTPEARKDARDLWIKLVGAWPDDEPAIARALGAFAHAAVEREREEWSALLVAALGINDKMHIHGDHVTFDGSMNDASDFRELVNRLWHQENGWSK